ncbi:GTPase [Bacteriovorax sp. Seq25_V]|uniref:ribosome biogenesis GTPase Der n=1 Tax=Bacteriovorax sp. Seq25_V TaxID=1201288 RepID=UPI00038A0291|nr:GTPase [Bacteriovorax sp. Seq25_V]EQC46028.1 ferrous iron transport protein B [Bacteriovorax sp. Seq25_V]
MKTRAMVISLIGRPNVGKSSVFNRLMKKQHKAITYDMPGVTRDRHYGITEFTDVSEENPLEAILVDTGGFYPDKIDETGKNVQEENANKFFNIMTEHAHQAIDESDLVLFVVDVREGALPFDNTIADYIRKQKKKMWLVVNKFDSESQRGDEIDFYQLGVNSDEMFTVSAAHNIGVDPLREAIYKEMVDFTKSDKALVSAKLQTGVTPKEDVVARLAIIGAPNAGKSTLLNLLVGSQRALVSDIAGTTVDPIEGFFDLYFGHDAKKLEENKLRYFSGDNQLVQQYEEFRQNNPDLYTSLVSSYNLEEEDEDNMIFDNAEFDYDDEGFLDEDEQEFADEAGDRIYSQVFEGEEVDENQEFAEEEVIAQEEVVAEEVDEGSFWRSIHIVDTAGIRKQKKIDDFVESQSVYRSLRCIAESDICIFMIDAVKGVSHQDKRLIDIAVEKGCSVIMCLNKIDLLGDTVRDPAKKKEWLLNIRDMIPWLNYCDIMPISAKHSRGIKSLKKALIKTILIRQQNIPTGELNRFVLDLIDKHPIILRGSKGKRFRVKYASQIKTSPPTFLFFTNKSQGVPDNYRTYLKNGLRRAFPLDNTPIHLIFRTATDLLNRMAKVKS